MSTYVIWRKGQEIQFDSKLGLDRAADLVSENLSHRHSEFAESLVSGYRDGRLSSKQEAWLVFLAEELVNPIPEAEGELIGLTTAVQELQSKAKARVVLRLQGVTIKAVTKGINTGALYLFTPAGQYLGKVTAKGNLIASLDDETTATLKAAAADPVAAARAYGHDTGICSCCGRSLEDPVSVFGGIGPVCLERLAGSRDARRELERQFKDSQSLQLVVA